MKTLCIKSNKAWSSMYSPIDLAISFKSSNRMTPVSSLSYNFQTLCRPSRVLYSPTCEQTTSTNSSKFRILFVSLRAQMILTVCWFLLSSPTSSKTLTISWGSMVPLPSSSKIRKTSLSCSKSCGLTLSFQAEGTYFLTLALEAFPLRGDLELTGGTIVLPLIMLMMISYKIKFSNKYFKVTIYEKQHKKSEIEIKEL